MMGDYKINVDSLSRISEPYFFLVLWLIRNVWLWGRLNHVLNEEIDYCRGAPIFMALITKIKQLKKGKNGKKSIRKIVKKWTIFKRKLKDREKGKKRAEV